MATATRELPVILPVMLGLAEDLPDRILLSWRKSLKSVEVAEEDGSECAVCLDELKKKKKKTEEEDEEKSVSEMPCGHRFHLGCIGRWLRMHGSCPVCRYRIPEVEGKTERELWFIRVMESMDGDGDLGI